VNRKALMYYIAIAPTAPTKCFCVRCSQDKARRVLPGFKPYEGGGARYVARHRRTKLFRFVLRSHCRKGKIELTSAVPSLACRPNNPKKDCRFGALRAKLPRAFARQVRKAGIRKAPIFRTVPARETEVGTSSLTAFEGHPLRC
jgi:hypothetical protein